MRPDHYSPGSTHEPIKVIQAWNLNFCLGNVVKYIARAGRKGQRLHDLEKARTYIELEIMRIKEEMNNELSDQRTSAPRQDVEQATG